MEEKQIAVITGGSKGIGRAICIELAGSERHIIINYMGDKQGAEKTLTMSLSMTANCRKTGLCGLM